MGKNRYGKALCVGTEQDLYETRKEKIRLAYRYEGTAQIKEQNPYYKFKNGFTL
jgi:hypothetical protein